jgi:hypothetical protein
MIVQHRRQVLGIRTAMFWILLVLVADISHFAAVSRSELPPTVCKTTTLLEGIHLVLPPEEFFWVGLQCLFDTLLGGKVVGQRFDICFIEQVCPLITTKMLLAAAMP